jgi:hypothetical protein
MKWILVLHLITGGKDVQMRSTNHPDYAACEKAREAWNHTKDVKVVSSECVQAK